MLQKTITISGKRYNAKQIARLFDPQNMTNGEDYIIMIRGEKFIGNYRHIDGDGYYAPVCKPEDANAIALCSQGGDRPFAYTANIWMTL